jgi:hypothetical protein
MSANSGGGTVYPSGAPEYTPVLEGLRLSFSSFMCSVWLINDCHFVPFVFAIALSCDQLLLITSLVSFNFSCI